MPPVVGVLAEQLLQEEAFPLDAQGAEPPLGLAQGPLQVLAELSVEDVTKEGLLHEGNHAENAADDAD